jgi:hypothetical protein
MERSDIESASHINLKSDDQYFSLPLFISGERSIQMRATTVSRDWQNAQ